MDCEYRAKGGLKERDLKKKKWKTAFSVRFYKGKEDKEKNKELRA